MQAKSGTLFAACLVLVLLAGGASACINGAYSYTCHHGAVLVGWAVSDGKCFERHQYLNYPSACDGCVITASADSGYISVYVPGEGTVYCYYGNSLTIKACQAYCLESDSTIANGSYECFTASLYQNTCSCDRSCSLNNP